MTTENEKRILDDSERELLTVCPRKKLGTCKVDHRRPVLIEASYEYRHSYCINKRELCECGQHDVKTKPYTTAQVNKIIDDQRKKAEAVKLGKKDVR